MAFLAVLEDDWALRQQLVARLEQAHSVVPVHSWGGMERAVRERPVTGAVVDLKAVKPSPSKEGALGAMRSQFPHLGLVLLVRKHRDPFSLFRLGRAGIRNMVLVNLDDMERELARAVARAGEDGATAKTVRFLSPYLPRRELMVAYRAMDETHRGWTAESMAEAVGLTRPFLSERLKVFGLPSLGHFLLWCRLFHAGHWLEEPGRTGESVSRQLSYSSGAAFRRALKHYTGATPTQVREGGGLSLVLRAFALRNQLPAPRGVRRVTVA